jgi:xylan 1,4-beta-xylosidase
VRKTNPGNTEMKNGIDRRTAITTSLAVGLATSLPAQAGGVSRRVSLDVKATKGPVDRFFDLSVGSDFPGVLIREDSLAQLRTVVKELGFRYLRFHAIFHDVLGTVKIANGKVSYDWTKIDYLYDALLARGIKPFVELGFTPDAMKTSPNQVFYWKGNISHPEPVAWDALVEAFVRHLIERYGRHEVRAWYFEVWNEPNLGLFWDGADQAAYFELYGHTARRLKAIDPLLPVGGPATAGARWIAELLDYCHTTNAPIDFVAFHAYNVMGGFIDLDGKADLKLAPDDWVSNDILKARGEIAASKYPDLPIYVTEWSTSYSPRDPVHDSYISAPFILDRVKKMRGVAQGMSYWTFSDLFEENGPPPSSFHGGFGLLNREGIRKASYFAYKYLNGLKGLSIEPGDPQSLAAVDGGTVTLIIWDWAQPQTEESNRVFYRKLLPANPSKAAKVELSNLMPGTYSLRMHRTGYRANDAYSAYIDMGLPNDLTTEQVNVLHGLTRDAPERAQTIKVGADGKVSIDLSMRTNDVVMLTLARG